MGDDVVSAIPGVLINYSSWAQGLDTTLEKQAHALYDAIDVLAASHPDPKYLTIGPGDYVSNEVFNHALQCTLTDGWVGQVGQAFLAIEIKGLPPGLVRANYQDFLNGLVTTTQSELAGRVGGDPTTNLPPLPADPGQRAAWWKRLTADEQAAYLRYDAADVAFLATADQLHIAGFANLKDVYIQQLYMEAGIDPGAWDVTAGLDKLRGINEKLYAYYQHVFDGNPGITWAGLAKLVGGVVLGDLQSLDSWRKTASSAWTQVGEGLEGFVLGGPLGGLGAWGAGKYASSELSYYETEFFKIQKAIFDDMGPQLAAYTHGGVYATNALFAQGAIDAQTASSWAKIAAGDIAGGNLGLAQHEQTVVVTPFYDQMHAHGITGGIMTATLSKDAVSPVPGGTGFHQAVPGGNLANVGDRWQWVQGTLMPDYRHFLQQPNARQVIDEPLDQLASQYSISPFSILP